MKDFPLKNFWDHVIVVNTFANPGDETFREFMEEPHEKYIETILQCNNLINFIKNNNIENTKDIKQTIMGAVLAFALPILVTAFGRAIAAIL